MSWRSVLAGAVVLAGLVASTRQSAAYCQLRTCNPDESECATNLRGCVTEGELLFYDPPCLSFAVAAGTAEPLGLSDEEFLEVVEEAFGRWASVDCGGGRAPGFEYQSAGVVETSGKFFCEERPELNASVWSISREWPYEASSLGYTTSTYEVESGQVFDADVELHLTKIEQRDFPQAALRAVLLSIVTHEAGHFLGLAHSDDPDAVMAAAYSDRELLERPLTQDDAEGICAIYPPENGPDACSEPGVSEAALGSEACEMASRPPDESCAMAPAQTSSTRNLPPMLGLGLLLLLSLGRRRQHPAKPRCNRTLALVR